MLPNLAPLPINVKGGRMSELRARETGGKLLQAKPKYLILQKPLDSDVPYVINLTDGIINRIDRYIVSTVYAIFCEQLEEQPHMVYDFNDPIDFVCNNFKPEYPLSKRKATRLKHMASQREGEWTDAQNYLFDVFLIFALMRNQLKPGQNFYGDVENRYTDFMSKNIPPEEVHFINFVFFKMGRSSDEQSNIHSNECGIRIRRFRAEFIARDQRSDTFMDDTDDYK